MSEEIIFRGKIFKKSTEVYDSNTRCMIPIFVYRDENKIVEMITKTGLRKFLFTHKTFNRPNGASVWMNY